jgi:hypothetical protein
MGLGPVEMAMMLLWPAVMTLVPARVAPNRPLLPPAIFSGLADVTPTARRRCALNGCLGAKRRYAEQHGKEDRGGEGAMAKQLSHQRLLPMGHTSVGGHTHPCATYFLARPAASLRELLPLALYCFSARATSPWTAHTLLHRGAGPDWSIFRVWTHPTMRCVW